MAIALHGEVVRDAAHRYWLTTVTPHRELVGVSAVMRDAAYVDDRWFTADSRDRGHLVHEITERIDAHDHRWQSWTIFDHELGGYGASYELYLIEHRPTWFLTEAIVYDAALGYAGTIDRFGLIDDATLILPDFKSGGSMPSHGVQTAAYRRCLPKDWLEQIASAHRIAPALAEKVARLAKPGALAPIKRGTLLLQSDGSRAPFVPHTAPEDDVAFLSALNCYHWRSKHVRTRRDTAAVA